MARAQPPAGEAATLEKRRSEASQSMAGAVRSKRKALAFSVAGFFWHGGRRPVVGELGLALYEDAVELIVSQSPRLFRSP
jgi:hypothetical protein